MASTKVIEAGEIKVYDKALLSFSGVDGFDVYNCSIPFKKDNKTYIYGRVERRNEWARSHVRLFEETEKDKFTVVKDSMIYNYLEDPFIAFIGETLVLGGTQVEYDGGKLSTYKSCFYRGTDLNDLYLFASAPNRMKDVRLVELEDGRIGVFTRPNGRVGFTTIKDLNELTAENMQNAPLIDAVEAGEYGGCNQCYYLRSGKIGIIGHQAYHKPAGVVHYVNMSYVMDIETRKIIDKKVIGTRSCYTDNDSDFKPNTNNLSDVAFTSGYVMRPDGKVDLYSGLKDMCEGRITIDDPFADYR